MSHERAKPCTARVQANPIVGQHCITKCSCLPLRCSMCSLHGTQRSTTVAWRCLHHHLLR
eukprot:2631616-Amphidinium_carterae.2